MFKGFYNLTSGMLSQTRRLDVVANNMTNISTTGFKSEQYTDRTFQEHVLSRIGNKDKSNPQEIGGASYILAADRLYVDYIQGSLEPTGMNLNFALEGDGFFAVQTADGVAYTRAGNFSLDEDGYLCLPGEGRVLSTGGQPIMLGTEHITADARGNILDGNGQAVAQIAVYRFPDNDQLAKTPRGLFTGDGAQLVNDVIVHWQILERSNVDLAQQMISMMSSQRALQSASQVSKMYDQLMTKATTELGQA